MQKSVNMGCIELKINEQLPDGNSRIRTFKIENDTQASDYSEVWAIISQFVRTGELPKGWNVNEGKETIKDLFNVLQDIALNDKFVSNDSLKTLLLDGRISEKEFIEKMVGNTQWTISNDEYSPTLYSQNVLVLNSWGQNRKWFGFTKSKSFVISGNKFMNEGERTILSAYYFLTSEDNKALNQLITYQINSLYNDLNDTPDNNADIFAKLTWLANNHSLTLAMSLKNYYRIPVRKLKKKEQLKDPAKSLRGSFVKLNGNFYYFKSKTGTGYNVINITDEQKILHLNSDEIKYIYTPNFLYYGQVQHFLIDNVWYHYDKNKLIKSDDQISLFKEYFGLSDGERIVDIYDEKNGITLESKFGEQNFADLLPVGTKVRTATGIYIKDDNGNFMNGDQILDNSVIYAVYMNPANTKLWDLLFNIKTLDNIQYMSHDEIRCLMYEQFKFEDFEFVSSYFDKKLENINMRIRKKDNHVIIEIPSKVTINMQNIKLLIGAIKYFNWLKSSGQNFESKVWKDIQSYIINGNISETIPTDIINEINNVTPELEQTIKNKIESFYNLFPTDDPEVDELMNLMDAQSKINESCSI